MSRYLPPHLRQQSEDKTAPVSSTSSRLAPTTMASATRARTTFVPTNEDFPTLSSSKPARASNEASKRFSDLARSWGIQQVEEEEKRKRLEKEKINEEKLKKEQEDKERSFYQIGLVNRTRLLRSCSKSEQQVSYDLGGEEMVEEEEFYEEEEEEDVYELDAGWNQRRSKNDLY
jgi:hypothetical protein